MSLYDTGLYEFCRSVLYHLERYLPLYTSIDVKLAFVDRAEDYPAIFVERTGSIWTPPEAGRTHVLQACSFEVSVIGRTSGQRDELAKSVILALTQNEFSVLKMSEPRYLEDGTPNPGWDWDDQNLGSAGVSPIETEAMSVPSGGGRPDERHVEVIKFEMSLFGDTGGAGL